MLDPDQLAVYLVADPDQTSGEFLPIVEAALDGGVCIVQLRVKLGGDQRAYALALEVQKRCKHFGVPFLVNDRLGVALTSNADGIHVGGNDLPLAAIRAVASPDFVIGYSPESDTQAVLAHSANADYLGLGPVFPTGTKVDAGAPLGLGALKRRAHVSDLPAVAIGGITLENAAQVMATGVAGIAVIGAILRASNPREVASRLVEIVVEAKARRSSA